MSYKYLYGMRFSLEIIGGILVALFMGMLPFLEASTTEYKNPTEDVKMRGITMVAPPDEFSNDPMPAIKKVNADWVSFIPYGYTRKGQSSVHHNSDWQWWGERKEGICRSIELARDNQLNIMLKPQVYIPGGWVGDFNPQSEQGWKEWEASYEAYLFLFLDIAIEHEVELFCIGTEYKLAVQQREAYWRGLIAKIRSVYKGKLIYSSNWDSYDKVPFWDALDYVGISAYFPLCEEINPSEKTLGNAWKPIKKELRKFAAKTNKQILFTEYGYLSVDGCSGKTWELEKKVKQLKINEQAQANALESLYSGFWSEPYWAGGFLWKWFPEGQGHEGYPARDYTPQGKLAEQKLRKWYSN